MDQEHEQNPEASQPDVQPVGDANQPVVPSGSMTTPVDNPEPATVTTPQVEEAPVNPFATPVVEAGAPAPSPAPAESAPVNPFATEPQAQAVPPVFATTSAPTPPEKKSHKGLIIGLVVGLVVLLAVAGAGAYVWYTNFYVSKADYQKVADAWDGLSTAHSDLAAAAGQLANAAPSTSTLNAQIDSFDAQAKDLGNMRAVQKDADVKKAYDTLEASLQKEIGLLRAVAEFSDVASNCSSVTTRAEVTTCATEIRALKSEGSAELKAYETALANYLEGALNGKSVSYTSEEKAFTKASADMDTQTRSDATAFRDVVNKKIK